MEATAAKQAAVTTISVPELAAGEVLAGIILENGAPKHWVILLAGDVDDVRWKKAVEWAKELGGELPTRKEQSLLFANAAEHFQKDWYWSSEQRAGVESYAWPQLFGYGGQGWDPVSGRYRARAVRRVPIQ
jgi:hypothetical protein